MRCKRSVRAPRVVRSEVADPKPSRQSANKLPANNAPNILPGNSSEASSRIARRTAPCRAPPGADTPPPGRSVEKHRAQTDQTPPRCRRASARSARRNTRTAPGTGNATHGAPPAAGARPKNRTIERVLNFLSACSALVKKTATAPRIPEATTSIPRRPSATRMRSNTNGIANLAYAITATKKTAARKNASRSRLFSLPISPRNAKMFAYFVNTIARIDRGNASTFPTWARGSSAPSSSCGTYRGTARVR